MHLHSLCAFIRTHIFTGKFVAVNMNKACGMHILTQVDTCHTSAYTYIYYIYKFMKTTSLFDR
jgi:hypothetical protein